MTYWNEIEDTHLPIYKASPYQACRSIRECVNSQGYVGDLLTSSDVIFLGSCDIMSTWYEIDKQWARDIHKTKYSNSPFIALGTKTSSLPSIVRRLYAYITNFGAPKIVYMSLPRFDSYEYVNDEGHVYTASTNKKVADTAIKYDVVSKKSYDKWVARLTAQEFAQNPHNIRYVFEERFAFIETICKLHNIKLQWTINPTLHCIKVLHENISCFEDITDFMKESFVGTPLIKDMTRDLSIGPLTQMGMADKFYNPTGWNYDEIRLTIAQNYEWYANSDYKHNLKNVSDN